MKVSKRRSTKTSLQRWEVFLPALPGPPRVVKKRIDGLEFRAKVRRLELPVNQNERLHWRVKAKLTAEWRKHTASILLKERIPKLQKVRISAIMHRRVIGKADWVNDAERLKAPVDAMVELGIIPDDRREFVSYGSIDEQKMDERGVGITLIIEVIRESGE